jgi:adenine deaminase
LTLRNQIDKQAPTSISQSLVDVASGRSPADLVIQSGRWVSVQSGEIIPGTDIAISGERIAFVGPDVSHTIGPETQIIDASDRYMVPGLLDGHMHVESGMLTISEFVRAVVPHGTTAIFIDPHEIANIFGIDGVKLMVDEASIQPIHVWVQMPSCVPSAPGLETPGSSIGPDEVAEAMTWPGIIGLGEVMNFPGVIAGERKIHAEIAATQASHKIISGHYASPDLGIPFHTYVAGGASDDHEGTRMEDAAARVRQGMKAMLRYGSAWHDVAEGVRAITELGLDPRNFILCTDDCHSQTLVREGHVNRAVKQAVRHGVSPLIAIQMATSNTAEYFHLTQEIGMIAPGRYADILLLDKLYDFEPTLVIAKGLLVAENGLYKLASPDFQYPDWAIHSVHLKRPLQAVDFKLKVPQESANVSNEVIVNAIGVIENQAPTKHLRMQMPITGDELRTDRSKDIAKIAVIERHHSTGRIQLGFVSGFGFDKLCAIGSTVAHDSHQMIIVGTDDEDMAFAANELARIGGGQIVVRDQEIVGQVALPIAGLMSNQPAEEVARQAATILDGFRSCGCRLNNPNMQLSLLGLVVIPELRISDLGVVDVNQFKFIPVIES